MQCFTSSRCMIQTLSSRRLGAQKTGETSLDGSRSFPRKKCVDCVTFQKQKPLPRDMCIPTDQPFPPADTGRAIGRQKRAGNEDRGRQVVVNVSAARRATGYRRETCMSAVPAAHLCYGRYSVPDNPKCRNGICWRAILASDGALPHIGCKWQSRTAG